MGTEAQGVSWYYIPSQADDILLFPQQNDIDFLWVNVMVDDFLVLRSVRLPLLLSAA